jgi:hypothetical protein
MFPSSFRLRSQMVLAGFGECLFDDKPPARGRPCHSRRRPDR